MDYLYLVVSCVPHFSEELYIILLDYLTVDDRLLLGVTPKKLNTLGHHYVPRYADELFQCPDDTGRQTWTWSLCNDIVRTRKTLILSVIKYQHSDTARYYTKAEIRSTVCREWFLSRDLYPSCWSQFREVFRTHQAAG